MKDYDELSANDFDESINPPPQETDFDRIIERAMSRRDALKGILAFGSVAALGTTLMPKARSRSSASRHSQRNHQQHGKSLLMTTNDDDVSVVVECAGDACAAGNSAHRPRPASTTRRARA